MFFTLATIIVRFEFCRKFDESGGLSRLKLAMEHHSTMVCRITLKTVDLCDNIYVVLWLITEIKLPSI